MYRCLPSYTMYGDSTSPVAEPHVYSDILPARSTTRFMNPLRPSLSEDVLRPHCCAEAGFIAVSNSGCHVWVAGEFQLLVQAVNILEEARDGGGVG